MSEDSKNVGDIVMKNDGILGVVAALDDDHIPVIQNYGKANVIIDLPSFQKSTAVPNVSGGSILFPGIFDMVHFEEGTACRACGNRIEDVMVKMDTARSIWVVRVEHCGITSDFDIPITVPISARTMIECVEEFNKFEFKNVVKAAIEKGEKTVDEQKGGSK